MSACLRSSGEPSNPTSPMKSVPPTRLSARLRVVVRVRDRDRRQREYWERTLAAHEFLAMPSESLLQPKPKFPVWKRLAPLEHNRGKDPSDNACRRSCEVPGHVSIYFGQAAMEYTRQLAPDVTVDRQRSRTPDPWEDLPSAILRFCSATTRTAKRPRSARCTAGLGSSLKGTL